MMLVTLQQARDHIRSDASADDNDLTLKIKAASRAVVTYLKAPSFADSSGQVPVDTAGIAIDVPEDIQIATLLLIGTFYKEREGAQEGAIDAQFGYGYLPRPVIALLYPYRVPTTSAPTASTSTDPARCWPWWYRCGGC